MKKHLLFLAVFVASTVGAADLPTISIDHLYYLMVRAERVQKLNADEMIEYCLTQKIGGASFETLYTQIFTLRLELTKLLKIEEIPATDPRVIQITKSREAYTNLLREEVKRVQNGIVREGVVATDTLKSIARAQNGR